MARVSRRIEVRLALAEGAIRSTLRDPELYERLAQYGYDTARLQEGSRLCENARAYNQYQKGEYGELKAANKALKATRQQIRERYMHDIEVARVVFRSNAAVRQKLDLANTRKSGQARWMEQARQFYSYALSEPAILRPLSIAGLTQERLEEIRRRLDAISEDSATQRERKGTARKATMTRDQAFAELNAWLTDFLKFARLACKGRPDLLNKLGLTPRAHDRPAHLLMTPPDPAPTPTAAPEGQPLSAERHNGHTATANREA